MNLTTLSEQVHADNKAKGFWDKERNLGELLMLVVSEAGEAIEAHRKGRFANLRVYEEMAVDIEMFHHEAFLANIKDTFEDELADIVIRMLDFAGWKKYDLHQPEGVDADNNVGAALLAVVAEVCWINEFEGEINDEFIADSVALTIERVYAIARNTGCDLDFHISHKLSYNRTRPAKHGKQY